MDIFRSLRKIYPDWRGVVWGNDYNRIIPHELETRPIPSFAELKAVASVVDVEIAREIVVAIRRAEYGSVESQLEMLYDDKIRGTNTWATHIAAVKARYPFPAVV